jgi:hypothetical protein
VLAFCDVLWLMLGGTMMLCHQCGEGALQCHSLVVAVDCCIILKQVTLLSPENG